MKKQQVHIGLRTIKTAAAVLLAMVIAGRFGGTGDKLIFAMLGAMAVIEPTFQASLEACLAQITGRRPSPSNMSSRKPVRSRSRPATVSRIFRLLS